MNADYKLLTSEVVKAINIDCQAPILHTVIGWRRNNYNKNIFYILYIDPSSKIKKHFMVFKRS